MNCNKKNKYLDDATFDDLRRALELKVGGPQAAEITEALKRSWRETGIPDVLVVKAASDVLEHFRAEAFDALDTLRRARKCRHPSPRVASLEVHRCRIEFRRQLRLYRIAMRLFYGLYGQAIAHYPKPGFPSWRACAASPRVAQAA